MDRRCFNRGYREGRLGIDRLASGGLHRRAYLNPAKAEAYRAGRRLGELERARQNRDNDSANEGRTGAQPP